MFFLFHQDSRGKHFPGLPKIYFVTPTYPRREQAAELTRLGQTLMHVPNIHWIVADDNRSCNVMVEKLLKRFGKFNSYFIMLQSINKGLYIKVQVKLFLLR